LLLIQENARVVTPGYCHLIPDLEEFCASRRGVREQRRDAGSVGKLHDIRRYVPYIEKIMDLPAKVIFELQVR
jgi:hypothetical protein